MTNNEILEGNKLIAEFMGLESKPLAKGLYQIQYKYSFTESGFNEWINEEMMKFNSSWDWLMPVVEKINSIPYIKGLDERTGEIRDSVGYVNIKKAWGYVVEFIKWYNLNK